MGRVYPDGNSGALAAELNRLLNDGVYPDRKDFLAPQGAANALAGTSGLGVVAALNILAEPTRQPKDYKDLDGVCNEIAGTTGLSAVRALEKVSNIAEYYLTKYASYYIDATAPTNWGSLGYVRLNGVTGNYLTVPDASNLDITGDIDLRAYVSLDDWTPSATQTIIGKWSGAGQRSYTLSIFTDGKIRLLWSADGTATFTRDSTVATGVADGSAKWIRATLDVDNGASGHDVIFYTSNDGSTWTKLGDTVTTAGTTSIFSSTSNVLLGTQDGLIFSTLHF